MNIPPALSQATLYDRDLALWYADTIAKLKAQEFTTLDIEHLIEELEALTGRDRSEVDTRLRQLFAHLLKRAYVDNPNDFRGWEISIREQRRQLETLLDHSPSLQNYLLKAIPKAWTKALMDVQEDYPRTTFPNIYPFSQNVERLLTEKFWEPRQ